MAPLLIVGTGGGIICPRIDYSLRPEVHKYQLDKDSLAVAEERSIVS